MKPITLQFVDLKRENPLKEKNTHQKKMSKMSSFFRNSVVEPSTIWSVLKNHKESNISITNPEMGLITLYRALIFLIKIIRNKALSPSGNANSGENICVLFLNTDPDLTTIVKSTAISCEQHYINTKWVGGTLTNWIQVSKSIRAYQKFHRRWAKVLEKKKLMLPPFEKMKYCFSGYFNGDNQKASFSTPLLKKTRRGPSVERSFPWQLRSLQYQLNPRTLFLSSKDKYYINFLLTRRNPKIGENGNYEKNREVYINRSHITNIFFDPPKEKNWTKKKPFSNPFPPLTPCFKRSLTNLEKKYIKSRKMTHKKYTVQKPDILIVTNPYMNQAPIYEAKLQNIPVIAFVESETDIRGVTFPIIGNNQDKPFLSFCLNWIQVILEKETIKKDFSPK